MYQKLGRAKQINGFEYEFKACFEALGKIECDVMKHDEILKAISLMDELRKIVKIKFIGKCSTSTDKVSFNIIK
ncbi:hypothetical protein QMK15_09740 [Campylobacter jejuni]|nr:hypothetical protein QMK15_09740 [Campylobacter jejuni]